MATIKEVAGRARVSVGTVSNVIGGVVAVRGNLKERVVKAMEELDYHPDHNARSLKTRQTKMLGMVISDITNPFFPQLVRGAEDVAVENGYLLVTFNTDDKLEREKQVLSMLRSRRVDGLLLVTAPNGGNVDHIKSALAADIPIVCLDRIPRGLPVDSITVDNLNGAEICVRHLLQLGHTRIATIAGSSDLQTARERLKGYENALRGKGLPVDPVLVREGNFRIDSGYRLGKELCLLSEPPTAIFVANGMMALGVLKAFRELGLECPGDMALAAFDGFPNTEGFRPEITFVSQPSYEMGSKGAQLLIQRIGGQLPARRTHIRLDPELNARESTLEYPRLHTLRAGLPQLTGSRLQSY
jgi:LacI family transcriptional regulator